MARDQFCRTTWCDALIRHIDHINPAEDGGETSADNAQGLCQACNYAKQAPGWKQTTGQTSQASDEVSQTSQTGQVITTTPTGHQYASSPPRPPRPPGQSGQSGQPPSAHRPGQSERRQAA